MRPIRHAMLAGACAALALFTQGASAQDYPSRPMRLVTMFAPGSNSDTTARFGAAKLSEQLGVAVIVDNTPGGGGIIAMRDVYRAQPMGYSILQANTAFVGNTFAFKEPGYKLDDYTPMGVLGESHYGLIIHNSVPANTVAEFVAYAKANPGKLNYGALGPAAGSTLNAERFKQAAGIDMVGIPFKGGEPVAVALLAGQVHVYWATLQTARNRMRNPQIKGLAVTAEERSAILPQLPTFAEAGYPTMLMTSMQAWFVPSAVTPAQLKRLRDAYGRTSTTPEWRKTMENNELEPYKGTPEQFMAKLRKEAALLAEDYKRLKLPQE